MSLVSQAYYTILVHLTDSGTSYNALVSYCISVRMDPVVHIPIGAEEKSVNSGASRAVEGILRTVLPQD